MGDFAPASPPQAPQSRQNGAPAASGAKDIHVVITGFGVCGNPMTESMGWFVKDCFSAS